MNAGRSLNRDRSQRMMPGPARALANHLPALSKHQELQAPFGHLSADLPLGFLCHLMSIESLGNVHYAPQKEIVT